MIYGYIRVSATSSASAPKRLWLGNVPRVWFWGVPKGGKNSPEKYKLFGKEILIKEGIISPKI